MGVSHNTIHALLQDGAIRWSEALPVHLVSDKEALKKASRVATQMAIARHVEDKIRRKGYRVNKELHALIRSTAKNLDALPLDPKSKDYLSVSENELIQALTPYTLRDVAHMVGNSDREFLLNLFSVVPRRAGYVLAVAKSDAFKLKGQVLIRKVHLRNVLGIEPIGQIEYRFLEDLKPEQD
ncbi:MAG: hypothetical protein KF799_15190 [Bdellovibrionales bacterium]|nr:hypothetical protein [Bdellovibrionales bacterium]